MVSMALERGVRTCGERLPFPAVDASEDKKRIHMKIITSVGVGAGTNMYALWFRARAIRTAFKSYFQEPGVRVQKWVKGL